MPTNSLHGASHELRSVPAAPAHLPHLWTVRIRAFGGLCVISVFTEHVYFDGWLMVAKWPRPTAVRYT